jgi:uncharacterized membrane protein
VTWVLLSVAIAVAALVVLAVLVLGLWRKVKALSSTVSTAGEQVGRATDRLTAAQLAGPLGEPTQVPARPSST